MQACHTHSKISTGVLKMGEMTIRSPRQGHIGGPCLEAAPCERQNLPTRKRRANERHIANGNI